MLPPDEMLAALKEWWEPLLRRGRIFRDGVGGPVRYTIGDLDMVVDFPKAKVREYAGEETSYWFTIPADLVSTNIRDHEIDWSNSIFLSMQFEAGRVGKFNEFIYTFMKCLSRDRIEYVENWYAEQSDVSEDVQLGEWVVQRRCPHLRADLSKTGKIEDGVLTCSLHDWKWDLTSGQVPHDAGPPDPLAPGRGRPGARGAGPGRLTRAAGASAVDPHPDEQLAHRAAERVAVDSRMRAQARRRHRGREARATSARRYSSGPSGRADSPWAWRPPHAEEVARAA